MATRAIPETLVLLLLFLAGQGNSSTPLLAYPHPQTLLFPVSESDYSRDGAFEWHVTSGCNKTRTFNMFKYVVQITVKTSSLAYSANCSVEAMEARDGRTRYYPLLKRWCGYETPTVTASGDALTLRFKATIDTESYFNIQYMCVPASSSSMHFRSTPTTTRSWSTMRPYSWTTRKPMDSWSPWQIPTIPDIPLYQLTIPSFTRKPQSESSSTSSYSALSIYPFFAVPAAIFLAVCIGICRAVFTKRSLATRQTGQTNLRQTQRRTHTRQVSGGSGPSPQAVGRNIAEIQQQILLIRALAMLHRAARAAGAGSSGTTDSALLTTPPSYEDVVETSHQEEAPPAYSSLGFTSDAAASPPLYPDHGPPPYPADRAATLTTDETINIVAMTSATSTCGQNTTRQETAYEIHDNQAFTGDCVQ